MPLSALHTVELQLCMQHLQCADLIRLARCSQTTLAASRAPFAWRYARCELRLTDVKRSLLKLKSLRITTAPPDVAVLRLVWFPTVPKDADGFGVSGVAEFLELAARCRPALSELHLAGPLDWFSGSQLWTILHHQALSGLRALNLHRICDQPRSNLPATAALTIDVVSRTLSAVAALPQLESLRGLFDSVDISPLAAAPALTHLSLLRAGHSTKRPAVTQVASLPQLLHLELRSPPLYRVAFRDLCESTTGRRLHTLDLRDVPIAKLLRSNSLTQTDLDHHFGHCFSALQSLRKLTLGSVAGVELLFPYLISHQPLLESLVIEPSCSEPDCEVDCRDPANVSFASADSLIPLLSSLPCLYVVIRLQRRRYGHASLDLLSEPELLTFGARFLVQLDPSLAELGAALPKPDRNPDNDDAAEPPFDPAPAKTKSKKCVVM